MRNITKAVKRAIALAALADPARNSNEAERAVALEKLIAHCAAHGLTVADYTKPTASPETGEQPKPKADAKPKREAKAKPAKADDRDAERERAQANRAATMRHYAGPSQASHATRAPKLAEAIERVRNPIQRAKSATARDESGLALAAKHANGNGDFCPIAATFDLGVLSRLASLKLIAVSPVANKLRITKAGRDLAANVAKKAA